VVTRTLPRFIALLPAPVLAPVLAPILALVLALCLGLPAAAQDQRQAQDQTQAQDRDSLRLILPQARPVAGEMIPLTIRGEYTGWIALEEMSFPDSPGYDWIQTGPDEWGDERVNGRQRRIFQRHVAIFPSKPGRLTIGPVTHVLTKAEGNARIETRVTASPVSVDVQPFPAPGRPLAARSLTVTDELSGDPAHIRSDQTIRRRITLTAQGSMGHLLPARPELHEAWLISFTVPEKRETILTEQGPTAFVQWEWNLRPITGEQGTLPPIRFSWFDTGKREMRGAVTQPIPFGYGKLAENIGGAARLPRASRWLLLAALAGGSVAGLLALVSGQGPATRRSMALFWRRMLPNPARPALRATARRDDLFALRRAARDYARHEAAMGRSTAAAAAALARLDDVLFGSTAGTDFDRRAFLKDLTRRSRNRGGAGDAGRFQPDGRAPRPDAVRR